VQNAGIATGLMKRQLSLFFQHHQSQVRASLLQLPCRGQSHNAPANHSHIDQTHDWFTSMEDDSE
jgi:hypothetical protein